mgnify:CR=1 FL=1
MQNDILIDSSCFDTAKENMDYDSTLLRQSQQIQKVQYRLYSWVKPSVTFSYHSDLVEDLLTIDWSRRMTGGGIVFHCPDDVLLTVVCPFEKGSVKAYLLRWAQLLQTVYLKQGVEVSLGGGQSVLNRQFCQTYKSPYEGFFEGQKLWGMAVRKFKRSLLLHLIFHLGNGAVFNHLLDEYRSFLPSVDDNGLSLERVLLLSDLKNAMINAKF